jgi:GT2 family glycosyltransferase
VSRPAVSVVVPFAGTAAEAASALAALGRLRLTDADELLLVDNTADGTARTVAGEHRAVRYVAAPSTASSYHARNVGAVAAANDWLLFLDADCVPEPDLLDRFFAAPVPETWGAVAGGVRPVATESAVGRYSASRGLLDQAICREHPYRPMAVTANLLVRRSAYRAAGGFHEVRSGGDTDFSWRVQELGWELGLREDPAVEHRHRDDLRALARQTARYGASRAWLARRHPASALPPRPVRELARAAAGVAVWTLTGRFERARFKAIDGVATVADTVGWFAGNGPKSRDAVVASG